MSEQIPLESRRPARATIRAAWLVAAAFAALPTAASAEPAEVVGTVAAVQGAVFATSPGEERRILQHRDPIHAGDEVLTLDDSAVAIDSGSYYVRLGENTKAEIDVLASGAPAVELQEGHVRLLDLEKGSGDSAELTTPGLKVARTGPDQDAMVFAEKAGPVSVVCTYGSPLDVQSLGDPNTFRNAPSGGCVVGKLGEPLFGADASHAPLAVLASDGGGAATAPAADRFAPGDVALGPTLASTGPGGGQPPPGPLSPAAAAPQPCAGGCVTSGGSGPPPGPPGLPTGFPNLPPFP